MFGYVNGSACICGCDGCIGGPWPGIVVGITFASAICSGGGPPCASIVGRFEPIAGTGCEPITPGGA